MKGATSPRSPAQWPVVPPALHFALRNFPVPGGAGGRQSWPLDLDVTCRRNLITDHRLNK